MLKYLTPATLEKIYIDLDEARIAVINETTERNTGPQMKKYQLLGKKMDKVAAHYKANTSEDIY